MLKTALLICVCVCAAASAAWIYSVNRTPHVSSDELFLDAIAALDRKELDKADSLARKLARHPASAPQHHLLAGMILLERGQPNEAFEELRLTTPEGPLRAVALKSMGRCLHQMGNLAEARKLLLEHVHEKPDDTQAWLEIAAISHDCGDIPAAVKIIDQVVKVEPDSYLAYSLLGDIYGNTQRDSITVSHYQRALALSPPEAEAQVLWQKLAAAHIRLQQYTEALKLLEKASPGPKTSTLQAECHLNLGNYEGAASAVQHALSLNSSFRDALYIEARIAGEQGQPEKVVELLEPFLKQYPHNPDARYVLAMAYSRLGNRDAYELQMRKKTETDALNNELRTLYAQSAASPSDPAVRNRIAEILESMDQKSHAALWREAARATETSGELARRIRLENPDDSRETTRSK